MDLILESFLIEEGSYRVQDEDRSAFVDAEIEISPNIVVQIDWGGPEYGLTLEPRRSKDDNEFEHIGYFKATESLFAAIGRYLPRRSERRVQVKTEPTWRELMMGFAQERKEFTLEQLYEAMAEHPRVLKNPNYRSKLRQVVQEDKRLRNVGKGRYALRGDETGKEESNSSRFVEAAGG